MTATDPSALGFSNPRPVVQAKYKGRDVFFAIIDPDIAKRLGVSEEDTTFEQAITDQGVILRIKRKGAAA